MKKKILFIIDTLQTGGAEKSLLDITSRLKHFTPIFIQLFPGDGLLEDYQKKNIEVIQLNLIPSYRFKEIAQKIQPILEDVKPVLIHSTLFISDMVARTLCKKNNIPLINSFVNNSYSAVRYNNLSFIGKVKLKLVEFYDRYTAKHVNIFISNSKTIKKSNASALKIPLDKIKVIYRGRDINSFEINNEEAENLKKELNLGSQNILLNVSRLLDRKGQLDLIQAFSNVREKMKDTVLLIAGEGPYRSTLEQQIEKNNLENSVFLLGNRSDIPQLLKIADVFVFPTYYEGLPGALIEGILSKKPIIATNISENRECIASNNAFFFTVGDIETLSKMLVEALANYDYSKVDRAYSEAVNKFDIDYVVNQYEENYITLLKK